MVLVMMAMVYLSIFKDVLKETVLQDSVSSYYFVRMYNYYVYFGTGGYSVYLSVRNL